MSVLKHISGYCFFSIADCEALKKRLLQSAEALELRGTILIGPEGINLMLAGLEAALATFKQTLARVDARCETIHYKQNDVTENPFKRLKVRVKKEIIKFNQPDIDPAEKAAPRITPKELKDWYDSNKEFVILDTRNDYEVAYGTFKNAQHFNIEYFRDFSDALDEQGEQFKDKTIVTFCTGGIRCEKAAIHMQNKGYNDVYQLDGGIIHYFQECGGDEFEGECFVFDDRVAVNADCTPTETGQCIVCDFPIYPGEEHHCQ